MLVNGTNKTILLFIKYFIYRLLKIILQGDLYGLSVLRDNLFFIEKILNIILKEHY